MRSFLLYVQLTNEGHCCYKSSSSVSAAVLRHLPRHHAPCLEYPSSTPRSPLQDVRGVCPPSARPNNLRLLKHGEQVSKSAHLSETDIQAHAYGYFCHAYADNHDECSSSNVSAAPRRCSDLFCL